MDQRPAPPGLAAGLESLGGMQRLFEGPWSTFVIPARRRSARPVGRELAIASATATMHGEHVGRMMDRDVRTAWGSGVNQVGGEEVTLDLGSVHAVEAVVLDVGAYSFGHPKGLEIALSSDGVG